jgi:acyl-CoA synthetase (AMP-forming)/AMP-acid ligase II
MTRRPSAGAEHSPAPDLAPLPPAPRERDGDARPGRPAREAARHLAGHHVERLPRQLRARRVCAGRARGPPTDRVAIQSENRPEWLYVDLGANMLRAAVVGFYPTNPVAEIRYLLQDSGARVLVAEDQEQVDKAMAVIDEVETLEWVVYLDSRGLTDYDDERLLSLDDGDRPRRRAAGERPRPHRPGRRREDARGPRHPHLHLRHDRPAQGRDALGRQHRVRH